MPSCKEFNDHILGSRVATDVIKICNILMTNPSINKSLHYPWNITVPSLYSACLKSPRRLISSKMLGDRRERLSNITQYTHKIVSPLANRDNLTEK